MARQVISLCFLISLLTGAVLAQDDRCGTQAVLQRYLYATEKDERRMRVAAFDHLNGEWSAWLWNGQTLDPIKPPMFEVPHTNEPTLIVPRGDDLKIVAVNTVPVLYSTKLTASTEADIQGIADLQKVAALLGNFVTSGVAHIADVDLRPASLQASVQSSMVQSNARAAAGDFLGVPRQPIVPRNDTQRDLVQFGEDLTAVLAQVRTDGKGVATRNAAIRTASKSAARQIAIIGAKHDEALVFLQLAESGSTQTAMLPDVAGIDTRLVEAFAGVRTARDASTDTAVICPAAIGAIDRGLVWEIDGEPTEAEPSLQFKQEWPKILEALSEGNLRECPADLFPRLVRIGRWFATFPPVVGGVEPTVREEFVEARLAIAEFQSALAQQDTLTTKATEMLGKRAGILKQATQLGNLAKANAEAFSDSDCGLRASVLPIRRVEGEDLKLSPTKVRTEEFSITVIPTFSADLERRHPDVTGRKYNLTRGSWDIDVDTAVVYTDIQDPEFQVSSEVVDIEPDPPADKPQTETVYHVTEKARDTRAGDLALLLTAKPKAAHGFGLQIGFGFDTSNPSIFGGLAFAVGDYVKISAGRTWQRVTRLGEDKDGNPYFLGRKVKSDTDINTREGFDNDWYAALSITIDNLPIFKRDE